MILASDYDQSCTDATECVDVFSGDTCSPNTCMCPNALINQSSYAKYQAAFDKLETHGRCPCGTGVGAACIGGKCVVSTN